MQKITKLISNYFNVWTSAENIKKSSRGRISANNQNVYGVQKLKELVLDLAISGKLTSRNTEDNKKIVLLRILIKKLKV